MSAVCDLALQITRDHLIQEYSLENVENIHDFSLNYIFKTVVKDEAC